MNILYAVTMLTRPYGGVCTHILDLCKGFSSANIILLADGNDFKQETDALHNVTYIDMPFLSALSSVGAFISCFRRFKAICKEHKIDIIHLHSQRLIPFAFMIKCTAKIPYLWTNHIDAIPQPKILSMMARILRFPIISVSADLKRQLTDELRVSASQITVINNGIDLDRYPPLTAEEKSLYREKFHIRPGDFVITELARLTYGKGQDLLVRAVHTLVNKHPELSIKLLFAGTGHQDWFENEVMAYARDNGINCIYLGFQSPRNVFGVSDLAALPSFFEGFPLVCVEAFAMECPIVRSNTPGHSDMPDIALTHQKGNLEDLTEKLEYAVTHFEEMKAMARAGRKKCETTFNTAAMCQQTMDLYQNIIEGKF